MNKVGVLHSEHIDNSRAIGYTISSLHCDDLVYAPSGDYLVSITMVEDPNFLIVVEISSLLRPSWCMFVYIVVLIVNSSESESEMSTTICGYPYTSRETDVQRFSPL